MPRLVTFDIFGTVVDWREGLREAVRSCGRDFSDQDFERVIDAQAVDEYGPFRSYTDITADSLVRTVGIDQVSAMQIGQRVGHFPLFHDSREALRGLLQHCDCVAMTNSDRLHGEQVQQQLGFELTDWVCAEEIRIYKPSPDFWHSVAERRKCELGSDWWHVSAYADYDHGTASSLGLTTVFVKRPHCRPSSANHVVNDLTELLTLIAQS